MKTLKTLAKLTAILTAAVVAVPVLTIMLTAAPITTVCCLSASVLLIGSVLRDCRR